MLYTPFLAPPMEEGSGNQTSFCKHDKASTGIIAICSSQSALYVLCRSICDRDQNWIKRSKAFLGADQGIKVTSKLLKSMDQERAAAIQPLSLWKSSNQEPQKGTIKRVLLIKILDPFCKHFNRQPISDYYLLPCNGVAAKTHCTLVVGPDNLTECSAVIVTHDES